MSTLDFIQNKFSLDLNGRCPIEIPNFGRNNMAELFAELGFTIGAEIGVAHGKFSKIMLDANPNIKMLYGIDPYVPHKGYRDYVSNKTFTILRTDAIKALGNKRNYKFIEKFSLDAVKDFEDESLDFVYIDGDHCFEAVVADIAAWLPKVRKGGIISGDDYFRSKGNARIHLMDAVQGYTNAWGIKPWFVLGRQAKIEGEIRDSGRSWMWVKY